MMYKRITVLGGVTSLEQASTKILIDVSIKPQWVCCGWKRAAGAHLMGWEQTRAILEQSALITSCCTATEVYPPVAGQTLSIIALFNMQWPLIMEYIFNIAGILSFEMDIIQPQCATDNWGCVTLMCCFEETILQWSVGHVSGLGPSTLHTALERRALNLTMAIEISV
eukprot:1150138-Pelagomonas_calceolata.AAC.9